MEAGEWLNATDFNTSTIYVIVLKSSISLACILSIIGSILIVLAYVAFKDTRTRARQLLVNLSIADLATAFGNLFGLLINFETRLSTDGAESKWISGLCLAQAFVAQYGTNSSILWTIALAFYMLLMIVFKAYKLANRLTLVYYIISWGIPLIIMVWFAAVGYLGFELHTTPGWCSIKTDPIYAVTVGYTAFVYIAFLVLPLMNLSICFHKKIIERRNPEYNSQYRSVSRIVDLKLTLIPLIFIVLRVWGLVVDVIAFQISDRELKEKFIMSWIGKVFIILKGIGDSSQGFANSILFIGFTPSIRKRFFRTFRKLYQRCRKRWSPVQMKGMADEIDSLMNSSSDKFSSNYENFTDPNTSISTQHSTIGINSNTD